MATLINTYETFEPEDVHDTPCFHPAVRKQLLEVLTPRIISSWISISLDMAKGPLFFAVRWLDFATIFSIPMLIFLTADAINTSMVVLVFAILPIIYKTFPDELTWPFEME